MVSFSGIGGLGFLSLVCCCLWIDCVGFVWIVRFLICLVYCGLRFGFVVGLAGDCGFWVVWVDLFLFLLLFGLLWLWFT